MIHPIGGALLTVEDKIGAQLQQPTTAFLDRFGKGTWCRSIHGVGQLRFRFRLVDFGVSTSVQHPVGAVLIHRHATSLGIGQINGQQPVPTTTTAGQQLNPLWSRCDQRLAQLSRCSGEQHPHRKTSPAALA